MMTAVKVLGTTSSDVLLTLASRRGTEAANSRHAFACNIAALNQITTSSRTTRADASPIQHTMHGAVFSLETTTSFSAEY